LFFGPVKGQLFRPTKFNYELAQASPAPDFDCSGNATAKKSLFAKT
jgi:hypothetical protein